MLLLNLLFFKSCATFAAMNKFLILLCLLLTSCAFARNMNKVSVGMSKDQVLSTLGQPTSTSAQHGVEYMKYDLYNSVYMLETHYVRIIDGKVESYGKMGDFDSSAVPEQKVTVDFNQRTLP